MCDTCLAYVCPECCDIDDDGICECLNCIETRIRKYNTEGRRIKKCKIDDWNIYTQRRTTACCQNPATMEVHDLSGNIIGKCCPYHAKQTEILIQAVNGAVTGQASKN